MKSKRVLVLGGGFAGVEASIFLKKEGFDVTLVSNRDYLYIYPISIWIPTREVKPEDVELSLTELSQTHKFDLIIDEVSKIEAKSKKVYLKNQEVNYDYLVVAIGSGKAKPKGSENYLSICGAPEEAIGIRAQIDGLLQKKKGKIAIGFGGNPKDKTAIRGGPAFEVMFNIHHLLKQKGIRKNFELTFFAPMPKPGAKMGEKALKMMDMFFKKLDIKKQFGKKIKEFKPNEVIFEDDSKLDSDFIMFIPANAGHHVLKESDLPLTEAGFIKINDYCQVEDFSDVFAIGDVSYIEGPEWRAKQGHIAEVMARNTAYNIKSIETNRDKKKGYQEHLNILCIMDSGDGAAFVYRNSKKSMMIPMPIFGHWIKKLWGSYYKLSKRGKIPRIWGL